MLNEILYICYYCWRKKHVLRRINPARNVVRETIWPLNACLQQCKWQTNKLQIPTMISCSMALVCTLLVKKPFSRIWTTARYARSFGWTAEQLQTSFRESMHEIRLLDQQNLGWGYGTICLSYRWPRWSSNCTTQIPKRILTFSSEKKTSCHCSNVMPWNISLRQYQQMKLFS